MNCENLGELVPFLKFFLGYTGIAIIAIAFSLWKSG